MCDADQVSTLLDLWTLRLLSFNLSPPPLPSCICPSIILRVGLGGRVLIPPSHLSLFSGQMRRWRRKMGREGGGGVEGRRPQITFHNISAPLWGGEMKKCCRWCMQIYSAIGHDVFNRYEKELRMLEGWVCVWGDAKQLFCMFITWDLVWIYMYMLWGLCKVWVSSKGQ